MSKGKKGAAAAPPPVEEPPAVVVEEKPPEPQYNANQQRVIFPKLPIKKIVSYHSSTILANPEPVIDLTSEQEAVLQQGYSSKEHDLPSGKKGISLPELLSIVCEAFPTIPSSHPLLNELALKYQDLYLPHCQGEEGFTWLESLQFTKHFVADAFYYGQHLRMYAGRGLPSEVLTLLIRGCDINTANGEGLTSLHYACEHNKVEIIDVLMQFNAQGLVVNASDKYGWTPLHCAVHHGNLPCVKKLLELPGIDIEAVNHQGKTALHLGCAQNRGTIVFYLLTHGANMLATDNRGMTPLHEVAYRNHLSLYQELVQDYCTNKGILKDISALQDDLGNTPENYINPPSEESKSPQSPRNQNEAYPPYPPNSPSNASTTSRTSKGTRLSQEANKAAPAPAEPPAAAKGKAGKK